MPLTVPPDATATPSLPATCSVKRWVVWAPGFHKGELYSPQRSNQIVANFQRLTKQLRHTIPRAGVGHDKQQRFAKSLGFGNVGEITACDPVPGHDGYFQIDVENVPTEVGGEISAGRIAGGSVELKGHMADPEDPAQTVPGDVLTGVAFLGEEQPAVRGFSPDLQERSRPRATFADGRPVPANASPARWLNAMADVTRQMAAECGGEFDQAKRRLRVKGREFTADTVCFSDFNPTDAPTMTPEQEAALQAAGFTPEQIQAMKAALPQAGAAAPVTASAGTPAAGAAAPGAVMSADPKKGDAAGGDMPPWAKQMSDDVKKMSDEVCEVKKRQGEFAAFADAEQKKKDEATIAAFSAHYEPKLKELEDKVPPVVLETVVRPAMKDIANGKAFSAETDRYKAADALLKPYQSMPRDPKLVTPNKPAVTVDGKPVLTPLQEGMLNSESMRRAAPGVRDKLVGAAAR